MAGLCLSQYDQGEPLAEVLSAPCLGNLKTQVGGGVTARAAYREICIR